MRGLKWVWAVGLAAVAALSAGMALAAGGDAKIEATRFTVDHDQTGEANAKCGRGKRALGGGVVPIGSAEIRARGPLDASGLTANTNDGDTAKQWHAAVANSTAGDDKALRVLAICSRGR